MNHENLYSLYIQRLNSYLARTIDYPRLSRSCNSPDQDYAKDILKQMHDLFVEVYGDAPLDRSYGFVPVPGLIRNQRTGKIALALLELSIEDGGEHFGTQVLSMAGPLDLHGQEGLTAEITSDLYLPYDYWYTIDMPCDIHANTDVPMEVQSLLDACLPDQPHMTMR